jgi:hypothetical protein
MDSYISFSIRIDDERKQDGASPPPRPFLRSRAATLGQPFGPAIPEGLPHRQQTYGG